jgi:hypothetical protein
VAIDAVMISRIPSGHSSRKSINDDNRAKYNGSLQTISHGTSISGKPLIRTVNTLRQMLLGAIEQ